MLQKTNLARAMLELEHLSVEILDEVISGATTNQIPLDAAALIVGKISEENLLESMQLAYSLPVQPTQSLQSLNTVDLSIFPQELAEFFGIVPFGTSDNGFVVLCSSPLDSQSIAQIEQRTQLKILPYLATSIRIAQMLNQLYNTTIPHFALPNPCLDSKKGSEAEHLIGNLASGHLQINHETIQRLTELASTVDPSIQNLFPGKLKLRNPLSSEKNRPRFSECSNLLKYLEHRGPSAIHIVLPHLDSSKPINRFFALYFFQTVIAPDGIEAISRRLYDSEPAVRDMAIEALRQYRGEKKYKNVINALIRQIRIPITQKKLTAIQILGQLREQRAVPIFISLLQNEESSAAISSALAVICAQHFGFDAALWTQWWVSNRDKPRVTWLIDALHHPDPSLRTIAYKELAQLTPFPIHYNPNSPKVLRDRAILKLTQGWQNPTPHQEFSAQP